MNKAIILRCLWVSLTISVIAYFLTTSVTSGVVLDSEMMDMSQVDTNILNEGSMEEIHNHMQTIPLRKVSFLDKLLHPFTHPQSFMFFILGAFNWFIGLFSATLIVSYLNAKSI